MQYITTELWRVLVAVGSIFAYALMSYLLYRKARRAPAPAPTSANQIWVIYASQNGQAEALARQTAQSLGQEGTQVCLRRIDEPWMGEVAHAQCVLFVVSTYGEGRSPDHALAFSGTYLPKPCAQLRGMRYGVLALGDRSYEDFCAFGRQLDQWLQSSGATPVFPRIDSDCLDAQSMSRWQQALTELGAKNAAPLPPSDEGYAPWRLTGRSCLNEGSPGALLFKLQLTPPAAVQAHWQAGDLVELIVPEAQGRARSYSIANLPDQGVLELIVRRLVHEDGQLGLASGWLTQTAKLEDTVPLKIRRNTNFHLQCSLDTPMILIGAGCGLAGLRGHLQNRADAIAASAQSAPPRSAWLLYGERTAQFDQPCREELETWQRERVLSKLSLTFSRDNPAKPYVQDALLDQAEEFKAWVEAGAHILICGSERGMARDVDKTMRHTLGNTRVDELIHSGRLRRDVF